MLHAQVDKAWTTEELAGALGMSRSAFADRFTAVVGEPPMTYLTHWRLALAADLLVASDDAIDVVARQVGYGSGFALSAAFKRWDQNRTLLHAKRRERENATAAFRRG